MVINDKTTLKNILRGVDGTIGFVPTMGALHDGHISLIKKARAENDIVVVSIFVNPTQFLEGEDFDKYPNKTEADIKICQLCEVDYLFMPDITTMYDKDEVLVKAPKIKGFILEGSKRAGHFDGMLQIVLKLLNLVKPTNSYFGKKDAQQLSLINQMVKNFYLDTNIVECDIVREKDGLAYSSRNVYLTKEQRKDALYISKSLNIAANLIAKGELDSNTIQNSIKNTLEKAKQLDIEYIQIVDRSLNILNKVKLKNTIILIAVKVGSTRLIDNIWI